MKSAIKYGGIIAAGVAIWVLADHFLLHISRAGSNTEYLATLFFNLLQLAVIFVGIRALRQENRGRFTLGQGIRRGMAISLAYAVFAIVFFIAFYLVVGRKVLENEPAALGDDHLGTYALLRAFAALFLSAMIGGLIYSTVISYALKADQQAPKSPAGRRPQPATGRKVTQ